MTDNNAELVQEIADLIESADVGSSAHGDNFAVALCSYFSDHLDRPDGDEECNDDMPWSPWVIQQQEAAVKAVAESIIEALANRAAPALAASPVVPEGWLLERTADGPIGITHKESDRYLLVRPNTASQQFLFSFLSAILAAAPEPKK